MQVGEFYSHKGGEEYIRQNHAAELAEIESAINRLNAADVLCKVSDERTKPPLLFSPEALNFALKSLLCPLGWTIPSLGRKGFKEPRLYWDPSRNTFSNELNRIPRQHGLASREFREMDGIKNKVGLEIQFGKYAFMGYDIFSKMPIFASQGIIKCGIEVVAMPCLIPHMSTGVSSFSQIVMDMKGRGEADLDVPTLVIGVDCSKSGWAEVAKKRARFANNPQALFDSGEVRARRSGAKPGPK